MGIYERHSIIKQDIIITNFIVECLEEGCYIS